ncbi:acyl-coenzyme A diphosphatase NUDT19 [Calliphora vicina]|uniref:acyl-coenzyme A diphosphatase NUDT19 n=1 Tax=Calliphora vicina TaxID=7373 RepID=UPI00325B9C06
MTTSGEKVKSPVWRESSSLIICAKSPEKLSEYDYRILILKRSDRTALIKEQGVFPGGIYDPFDESIEWLKYFEEFGVTQQSLKELVIIDGETERPKILAPQGTGCYDRFFKNSKIWAREISLRINAIRETFEEVGVFLCRNREQLLNNSITGFYIEKYDKLKWQKLVHEDPKEFLNMCKELNVVPDLWGLHEWCGWASPAIIKRGYETAFFITFLNEIPKVLCEETEVKECLWLPPPTFLQMVREAKLSFLPPQVYELSRLVPYKSFDYLKQFSWDRRKKGITMYRPIGHVCTDGVVFVFPGDDFYTGDPYQATVTRNMECTRAEFRARSKCINRIENPVTPNAVLYSNIKPFNGHLMPVSSRGDELNKL